MPQMDGEQMTEVIKTLNPDVPVILITGLPGSLRRGIVGLNQRQQCGARAAQAGAERTRL